MRLRNAGRRGLVTAIVTLGGLALLVPAASAGPLVEDAEGCEPASLSTPFGRWLDPMKYTPVRDGGIERRAQGWHLSGGARPVAGNEPWKVSGAGDDSSLSLPAGASATTPAICVGLAEPTLRFFAEGPAGVVDRLDVEVLFEDAAGQVRALPIGTDLGGSWHPTTVMPVLANLLPLLPGGQTAVAFRFTAHGGSFRIDDVYVDPWCMR
jgi:hypothetical protein